MEKIQATASIMHFASEQYKVQINLLWQEGFGGMLFTDLCGTEKIAIEEANRIAETMNLNLVDWPYSDNNKNNKDEKPKITVGARVRPRSSKGEAIVKAIDTHTPNVNAIRACVQYIEGGVLALYPVLDLELIEPAPEEHVFEGMEIWYNYTTKSAYPRLSNGRGVLDALHQQQGKSDSYTMILRKESPGDVNSHID